MTWVGRRSGALPETIPRYSKIIQERIAACRLSRAIAKATGRPQVATLETIEIGCDLVDQRHRGEG